MIFYLIMISAFTQQDSYIQSRKPHKSGFNPTSHLIGFLSGKNVDFVSTPVLSYAFMTWDWENVS